MSYQTLVTCIECNGSGTLDCPKCDGTGRLYYPRIHYIENSDMETDGKNFERCFKCNGTGLVPCHRCGGNGEISEKYKWW